MVRNGIDFNIMPVCFILDIVVTLISKLDVTMNSMCLLEM